MRCANCGAEIPEEQLICPRCGMEVQIVPDYNPLDDVLAAQVKGELDKTMSLRNSTRPRRRMSTDGAGTRDRARTGRRGTSGSQQNTDINRRRQAEKRKQAEKRRQAAKRRRRRLILLLAGILAVIALLGFVIYQNSYVGQLKKGYTALAGENYEEALTRFQKAVKKNEKKPDAYVGMSKVYIAQDDLNKAEKVFLSAISDQKDNTELYQAAITFYLDTNQPEKVSVLLGDCGSETVLEALEKYISDPPEFSLDEDEVYEDVQALELSGTGKAIYYTVDGTEPTTSSTKYTEPITLNEEKTTVRAISVNEEGIPSLEAKKVFTIEFPSISAPNVKPSTGQYSTEQTIEVEQLDEYEIRYTTDGTMPDQKSELYTGPITMPEGSSLFTFVYIDKSGRISQSTMRSYEYIPSE